MIRYNSQDLEDEVVAATSAPATEADIERVQSELDEERKRNDEYRAESKRLWDRVYMYEERYKRI